MRGFRLQFCWTTDSARPNVIIKTNYCSEVILFGRDLRTRKFYVYSGTPEFECCCATAVPDAGPLGTRVCHRETQAYREIAPIPATEGTPNSNASQPASRRLLQLRCHSVERPAISAGLGPLVHINMLISALA
jgi:hypothetical protein